MTNDKMRMTRLAESLIILASCAILCGGCVHSNPNEDLFKPLPPEPAPHLTGRVSGNIYISSAGHFSVPFPVSTEVGGRVLHDDSESVVFRDNWGSRIGFSSGIIYPQSPMMDLLKSQGRKKALEAYAIHRYGDLIVPHYQPEIRDGAVSFIFLKPVGPKTGVALFIHDNRVYLVETDILPGVELLSKEDDASMAARDAWLENRAVELLETITTK